MKSGKLIRIIIVIILDILVLGGWGLIGYAFYTIIDQPLGKFFMGIYLVISGFLLFQIIEELANATYGKQ